jgi:hypothetical protein
MQPAASSIVPELAAVAEPKRENELEKIRKARTEKFTTPAIELKTPALIRVVEEENAGLGLEDKAYQGLKEQPTKMKVVFDQAAQDELQLSIFGEADPGASINLHPAEIIAPNQVKPNIDLPASELLSPPATKGLNFRNALRGLVSEARENKDFFETAESENWPVIDVKQDRLRELREQRLAAIKTTLKPKEEPKSLVSQVEQETDIVEEGTEPIITSPDPAASSLAGGQPVDVELAFAFPSPAAIEPPVAEEKSAITELNLGEQKQEPEPEPTAPVYKGGKLLPAIIQPVATDPVIKQLFAPRVEPSLAEAIGTEVVRPADVYTTETLVKGLPEAEATDAPTGKPKEQLIAFAKSLGVDTSSGIANKHLRTAEIQQRIRDKMGTDYEIPVFKARKPGPQKAPAIAEALTITDV